MPYGPALAARAWPPGTSRSVPCFPAPLYCGWIERWRGCCPFCKTAATYSPQIGVGRPRPCRRQEGGLSCGVTRRERELAICTARALSPPPGARRSASAVGSRQGALADARPEKEGDARSRMKSKDEKSPREVVPGGFFHSVTRLQYGRAGHARGDTTPAPRRRGCGTLTAIPRSVPCGHAL